MTQYLYDLTDSWSGGGTFDAIKMNVTDGGSNAASKLLNLQVGASPKFTVQKDGAVALTGAVTGATSITGSGTFTADRLTVTKTTANAPAISSTGYSLTGSDATSLVDLAGIWNTSGAPTAIKLNVTESSTPSAASLLLDLQRGGVSQFNVSRTGTVRGNFYYALAQDSGLYTPGFAVNYIVCNATTTVGFSNSTTSGGVAIKNDLPLTWATNPLQSGTDLFLWRDAANTLAQRNGTTTQAHRVYRTWTDASNYEALELAHATYSSAQYSILRTITAGSGADNINLVLSPSGTGAIIAQLPDGNATGGNARGAQSFDMQLERQSGTEVASGSYSVIIGARRTRASASYAVAIGANECIASGLNSCVLASLGGQATASYSISHGAQAIANKYGQIAHGAGKFANDGDAQRSMVVMRRATADANATELFLDGSSARLTIPANTAWHADIRIIGRQAGGTNHAIYHRKCCIERTVNATALVSTVQTIGTDIETDANWDVAITADDTNDALKIEVTGVAATNIRWVAEVQLVEVAYA